MDISRSALPIVVDLDGTLVANDLLLEAASRFVSQHPGSLGRLGGWVSQGKATLKHQLWDHAPVRVEHLRYHPDLLEWLRAEKAAGRTLVLASASTKDAVRAVAAHVGLFDEVLGSDEVNLRSETKAAALASRFPDGFEYVGNSTHDLPVWDQAAAAHIVSSSRSLRGKAARRAPLGRTFDSPQGSLRQWVKALRPHQWAKNALVFLPLLTAHLMTHPSALADAVLAFASFCLAASSVYLLNDIVDVENDREHPTKRSRPFAAGTLSLAQGWVVWPILAAVAIGIAFVVGTGFALVLMWYLATTTAYSFALKRKPVIDVLTLAALYTIRIVAGAAAIHVTLTMWLLSFSGFFFLSLALVKRVSELFRARLTDKAASGRGYQHQDLELLSSYGVSTSVVASLVFSLFVNDPSSAQLYQSPRLLWAILPILLWWLMRVWLRAHRGEMNEDPILFAIKDPKSLLAGLMIAVIFALATYCTF